MSSFVKLDWLDPYKAFASRLQLSRHAMRLSFDEAFRAYLRCHELLKQELWVNCPVDPAEWLLAEATGESPELIEPGQIQDFHYEAQVEDALADHQASSVLLFVDDALQSLARGLLRKEHKTLDGYGPRYEDVRDRSKPVALSTLLRAATNTIRHLSEWDDPKFPFPYPVAGHCKESACQVCRAIPNIDVIQRTFGIGIHERLRDVVSMRVLIKVDNRLGSDPGPSYENFENALIAAAYEVASRAGDVATERFKESILTISRQS